MRFYVVLFIVVAASAASLVYHRIALYTYIWFALLRPDFLAFAAGRLSLSFFLAIFVLLAVSRSLGSLPRLFSFLPLALTALVGIVFVSAHYATYPEEALVMFGQFFRICVISLAIPVLITARTHLRTLFLVTGISLGAPAVWYGLIGPLRGSTKISGALGGQMSENNTLALGMAMILPFLWFGRSLVRPTWAKAAFALMCLGTLATTVLTFSRGGALAFATALVLLVLQSRQRGLMVMLMVLSILPIGAVVGTAYVERLGTIATYEQDSSSMSRLIQLQVGWNVWKQHPWLGVGIGDYNYIETSRPFIPYGEFGAGEFAIHNSFMQALVHFGLFGFMVYMMLWAYALWSTWRSYRVLKNQQSLDAVYPSALFVSLVAYSVGSITQPRVGFDFYYMLLMFVAAWNSIVRHEPGAASAATVGGPPQESKFGASSGTAAGASGQRSSNRLGSGASRLPARP